jgi:FecR protein
MNDDYLWDGSGEPDPEIQRLEQTLGRFRHNRPAPSFDQVPDFPPAKQRARSLHLHWLQFGAVAATIVSAIGLSLFWVRPNPVNETAPGWNVVRIEGAPRLGAHPIGDGTRLSRFRVGQTLETDDSSRAVISLDETGRVEIDGHSRLRVLADGPEHKRLALDRGTIHARIWAPPGQFVVDTPSAVTVDLGCVYTLHVDDSGAGLVRTTMGWVGFKLNGHESFIPAGAVCATRPKTGPGTPYFEDASASFRDALSKFDFAEITRAQRNVLLGILLVDARKDDALTLWHLLARVSDADRPAVYDRLAALAPPPPGVTHAGILNLDQHMLDSWWNSLGFGDISLWRMYEHEWSQPQASAK